MEYFKDKMNILVKFLKKTGLISFDLIYRIYYMSIFGSKLYYRHKIASFRSCAFCKNLIYDKLIKKYVCMHGEYEACGSIVPCIVPDSSLMTSPVYHEEYEQTPWLFKTPCLGFDVLNSKEYFRNFLSLNINTSVIRLEVLEGILMGGCSGQLPCHICACVNLETFSKCRYIQKANELGKCGVIYDTLNQCYTASSEYSNAC